MPACLMRSTAKRFCMCLLVVVSAIVSPPSRLLPLLSFVHLLFKRQPAPTSHYRNANSVCVTNRGLDSRSTAASTSGSYCPAAASLLLPCFLPFLVALSLAGK